MTARIILLLCGTSLTLAACGGESADNAVQANQAAAPAGQTKAGQTSVGEALAASPDHSVLVQSLQTAGLMETLKGPAPYTLFAPGNAAFAALSEADRQRLASPEGKEQLIALLSYHIVPGTVTAEDLRKAAERGPQGRAELATVTGDNLALTQDGDTVRIGDGAGNRASIVRADQIHGNGVVHSIDRVLSPAG